MCEPTTLAIVGAYTAVAASAVSAYGDYQSGKAQNSALEDQAQTQADEAASARDQEIGERVKQSRRERARIRVSAGESGISGQSFEAQLKNSLGAENQDIAVAQKQGGFTERAIKNDLKVNRSRFSGVNAGLQIAETAGNAYNKTRKPPKADGGGD